MSVAMLSVKHYKSIMNYMIDDLSKKFDSGNDPRSIYLAWNHCFVGNYVNGKELEHFIEGAQLFVNDLYELNRQVYQNKYKETVSKANVINYQEFIDLGVKEFYQALQCIDYQIEESHLDDNYHNRMVIETMNAVIGLTARAIVSYDDCLANVETWFI